MLSTVAKATHGEIGHHQQRSQPVDGAEGERRHQDGDVQHDDGGDRRADLLQAEEHHGPAEIERELKREQRQRPARGVAVGAAPHAPGRHAHQDVEHGPYRPEHLVGRSEGRLDELGVPVSTLVAAIDGAERTDAEAQRHEQDQGYDVDEPAADGHGGLSEAGSRRH